MNIIELENKIKVYPIKFTPILKQKIWGGEKLISEFNKASKFSKIGESWEVSGVEENVSVVSNGVYKSMNLIDLIKKFKGELIGDENYNKHKGKFPLLFKFIDASDNLSIQLHPNDELAKKRHDSFGKTEMWYVLNADKDAVLYAGFNKNLDKESYLNVFNDDALLDVIHKDKVDKGDAFFIESGTIHAIGKGVFLAEIQQTSDITYRIYDWGRLGLDGNPRELHNDIAVDAVDFSKIGSCKLSFDNNENLPNQVYSCEYFTTNKIIVKEIFTRDVTNIDSFIVYMCVSGTGDIEINGNLENIFKGETVLVPAICDELTIRAEGEIELLEVYIK